jgi:serine/threonine protein kinase
VAIPLAYIEGKYEILEKLSEGGMGAIYKVRHRLLDAVRVIKVMQPQHEQDEALRARFLREARLAVRMRHPNIAQMYDFAVDEHNNAFIVMEYIDGITLQELLDRVGPPILGLTLALSNQALKAIGYLHRKGIIHRDIAPDNIMVARDEEGEPQVKLIDLGIAKWLEGEMGLTGTGMFLGKLRYASPEQFQAREDAPLDQRSDLYSFGLVLYELLTGKHAISGSTPPTLIAGHLLHPPTDFASSDPDGHVPADLRVAVLRALAKQPADRFANAADFSRALAEVQVRFPLALDDFERAMTLPAAPTQKIPVQAPGSTQDRLDRQFRMMSTPAPEPSLSGVTSRSGAADAGALQQPPPAPQGEAMLAQARALLLGAEKLASLKHYDEARLQLQAVLQIEPANAQARQLLDDVESALDRGRTVPGRETTAILRIAAAISASLETGELDEAAGALEQAERQHGAAPELETLRARLSELLAGRETTRRATALAAAAEEHLRTGDPAGAVEALRQACSLTPDRPELVERLRAAQSAAAVADEARHRKEAVGRAGDEIRALIAAGDAAKASRQLAKAVKRWGDAGVFADLREAIRLAAEEAQRARVAALIGEARERLGEGRHQVALAKLEQALGIDPGHAEAAALVKDVGEAIRRAEGIRKAAEGIGELIGGGQTEEASVALRAAFAEWGEEPPLVKQWDQLERARDRARRAKTAALIGRARDAAARAAFEDAIATLEEASALDRDDPLVRSLLVETVAAKAAHSAEEDRRAKIVLAVRAIEEVAATGDFEEALRRLADTVATLGDAEILASERTRLEELRRRRRRAELDALLEGARALLQAESYEDALDLLYRAGTMSVDQGEKDGIAVVAADAERNAEAQRQARKIGHAVESIEGRLSRGDLDEAEREMAIAEKLYGREPSLVSLRGRLKRLQQAACKATVENTIITARRLAESGKLDLAVAQLRVAAEREPESGPVGEALAEFERQQAESAVEQLLSAGDRRGARRALAVAEKMFGRSGRIPELRAMLTAEKEADGAE